MAESFVKTVKRDYKARPNENLAVAFEPCNKEHPHLRTLARRCTVAGIAG